MPVALWVLQSGMMLTSRLPHCVQTKRRSLVMSGNSVESPAPTASKVTWVECRQNAWEQVTLNRVTPMDFRLAIVGGGMRYGSPTRALAKDGARRLKEIP
jgi:hypothetical protein